MTRYVPVVKIGGVPVPPAWDGSSVAALAKLTLDWGRTDFFGEPDPTMLRFEVIDPDGAWSSDPARYDERVTVDIPELGLTIFRGDVTGVTSKRRRVMRPQEEGRPPVSVWVWMTTLTVADPKAALSRLVVPGVASTDADYHAAYTTWYDPGYWINHSTSTARIARLMTGAGAHVASIEAPADAVWNYVIKGSEHASVIDVVGFGYRGGVPGGHVNYRPDTNTLSCGRPATVSTLALTFTGGRLTLTSGVSGAVGFPAGKIGVPRDGVEVTSTLGDSIDTISIEAYDAPPMKWFPPGKKDGSYWVFPKLSDSTVAHEFQVPGAARKQRTLSVRTGHRKNATDPVTGQPAVDSGVGALGAGLRPLVAALNGRTVPHGVFYDVERHPRLTVAQDRVLFTTYDTPTAVFFPGAYTAGLPNHGPFFQIIGGTLAYDNGWTITPTLAPARATAGDPVTFTTWVTNPTATYADFDDTITWADFSAVTQGAA